MIKALLIVTALAGGGDYTTEMPSMKSCLDARIAIMKQDANVKTLCVPKNNDTVKVREFFAIFMDMINELKELEEIDRINRDAEQENWSCENCPRSN